MQKTGLLSRISHQGTKKGRPWISEVKETRDYAESEGCPSMTECSETQLGFHGLDHNFDHFLRWALAFQSKCLF